MSHSVPTTLTTFLTRVYGTYSPEAPLPLHAPQFTPHAETLVLSTLRSTFVSSVGAFVSEFEQGIAQFTGSPYAIATVNGTSALHLCCLLAGVQREDYVLTQPLTFVATCNAIAYTGATPLFVDTCPQTFGLCPTALHAFLEAHAFKDSDGTCRLNNTKRVIRACVVMHTLGHPARIKELLNVCEHWGITLIEDAAESLGSVYEGQHTGTFAPLAAISFNGNKILTTGGGGMVLCQEAHIAQRAKHLSTTAKQAHPWAFIHNEVGYNYRLPNLNAALGVAQLTELPQLLEAKRALAQAYQALPLPEGFAWVQEPEGCRSNYWLNTLQCPSEADRNQLLESLTASGVQARPVWELMPRLPMFAHTHTEASLPLSIPHAIHASETLLNLPSSPQAVLAD